MLFRSLITTNPAELIKLREEGTLKAKPPERPEYKPFERFNSDKYSILDKEARTEATITQTPTQQPETQIQPNPLAPQTPTNEGTISLIDDQKKDGDI